MACCGYAEGKRPLLRALLASVVSAVSGLLFLLLTPFEFVPTVRTLRTFFGSIYGSFFRGLRETLRQPLVGSRLRCVLAGRLLHLSPRISRVVYKHYNALLLAPVALIVIVLYLM